LTLNFFSARSTLVHESNSKIISKPTLISAKIKLFYLYILGHLLNTKLYENPPFHVYIINLRQISTHCTFTLASSYFVVILSKVWKTEAKNRKIKPFVLRATQLRCLAIQVRNSSQEHAKFPQWTNTSLGEWM